MTTEQIAEVENILQYTFVDKQLLITAFTHSSYVNLERDKSNCDLNSYERMAFFGDAILKTIVAEYMYGAFPSKGKGELSYMCSNLVSREGLSPIICGLGLTKYLRIVTDVNGALSNHLCADLYEAIVCAIYLDGGYLSAKQFVLNTLSVELSVADCGKQKDSKTLLQEYCQGLKPQKIVTYKQASRTGADNCPMYRYDLFIDDEYMCSGEGSSIKAAEQDAAKKLVTKWRID